MERTGLRKDATAHPCRLLTGPQSPGVVIPFTNTDHMLAVCTRAQTHTASMSHHHPRRFFTSSQSRSATHRKENCINPAVASKNYRILITPVKRAQSHADAIYVPRHTVTRLLPLRRVYGPISQPKCGQRFRSPLFWIATTYRRSTARR